MHLITHYHLRQLTHQLKEQPANLGHLQGEVALREADIVFSTAAGKGEESEPLHSGKLQILHQRYSRGNSYLIPYPIQNT